MGAKIAMPLALRTYSRYAFHMAESTTWVQLRVLRTKDGHSITSLSKAAGISVSYLSELESGSREPNAGMTKKLAVALNVPMSVLEKHRYHPEDAA